MKGVIDFFIKGIIKSKYIYMLPLAIILFIVSFQAINGMQSESTQKELQETFESRKETVNFLIGKTLNKKRNIGLPEEQQNALDSLLLQEEYLKKIVDKLSDNDLNISFENLAYLKEYEEYVNYNFINYNNVSILQVEQKKVEILKDKELPFTEQKTPSTTALFAKQVFFLLFSPITAFLFLLIFSYKYVADKQNRIFDFLKIHSLSNTTIYYGYLFPFLLIILGYIAVASILSLLPALLTGNIDTIHFPIEVINGAETILVPVWKWLLYLPIAWGIFVSLLAVLALCLFKMRFPLGAVFAAVGLSLTVAYIVQAQLGFFMWNPIHLIVSFESNLLPAHGFIAFLLGMFVLLLILLAVSYPIFKSRRLALRIKASSSTKKQYQPKGKLKLLQFEHIKKKRKGHLLFSLILLIGIMGGNFIIVNQQYDKLPVTYLKVIEDLQNILIEQQLHWKVLSDEFDTEREIRLQESDEEETELEEENPYVEMIDSYVYEYNVLEELKKDIHSPDFSDTYRETMNRLNTYTSYKELDRSFWTVTVMASEEQRHILEEKGITPWPIGDQWISHFQDPSVATDFDRYKLLKASQERNTKYDNSGLFTFYKLFDWNVMWLALGGFILLLWTSLSEEQRPTPSIHFLKTKPILLRSIYLNKWIYNMMIAYGLLLISAGSIFLISSLIGGTGESQYPILVYANSGNDNSFTLTLQTSEGGEGGNSTDGMFYSNQDNVNFSFESLLVLILKSGILVMGQVFFLNGLFTLVGRWLKNHYATIIITLLVSFLGYFVANQYIATPFMYVNPFVYFDTWNIVDGWKSIVASSTQVNFINGCISLFATGLLLFIVGWVSGRKRRMSS
ncbi:cytochrome b/b6 domain-containing protein [Sporosarcina cyprini]|uniref:cytochrome b/b6 domain-containing protein n=1 Tax=Sporosarcina cyprini TaxID=2910523 RepID=UPI001EDE4800|nr:cytochrome b/b6 domain-containing protein [Sporosarcina cyprini]MCG3087600.1 hypothetical protein [Sporosarcina cyprini]